MELLKEIVRSVLVIIIVASLLEMLLPEGGIKPFVRLAIGLFIMAAILNPVLALLYPAQEIQLDFWNYKLDEVQSEMALEKGKAVQAKILGQNQELMRQKIEGQISAMTLLIPGVESVEVEAEVDKYASIQKICLRVERTMSDSGDGGTLNVFLDRLGEEQNQESIRNKISSILSNLYGLQDKAIEIEFEGG